VVGPLLGALALPLRCAAAQKKQGALCAVRSAI
jgi:hypothetical protein